MGSSLLRACVLIGACLLLAIPLPGLAQNTAETPPPAKQPAEQSPGTNKAEKKPASKSSKKKKTAKKKEEPARNVTDAASAKGTTSDPAKDDKPADPPAAPDAAKDLPTPVEGTAGAKQAAGAAPDTAGVAGPVDPPAEGTESDLEKAAAAAAPPISEPGDLFKQLAPPNAAEGRAAGSEAGNRAEGLATNNEGLAEPPAPPFSLPTPEESAGSARDYVSPQISLNLPPVEQAPPLPSVDQFNKPTRDYLKDRPLPPPDATETDQERMARNIEESLKRINLALEMRPAEGIQIPLPSGVVTFKAAQAFQFDRRNRILTFTGDVEIIFSDIGVWADSIEINDSSATAYAKGSVAIRQRDEILYCDEAYINYDTLNLDLYNVEGNSSGPRIQGRLYYTALRAWGTFDHLTMEKAEVTTCDPFCGSPKEAHLSAHKAVYKRNTSIVLHDVYIYTREHKIGYIPLLAFPLPRSQHYEQPRSDIFQTYGYSRTEGFFAKFAYTYSTRYVDQVDNPLIGAVKLDLTQKLGPLFGIRQDFYIPSLGVTTIKSEYGRDWPQAIAHDILGRKESSNAKNYLVDFRQELNLSRYLTGSLHSTRENRVNPGSGIYAQSTRINTWQTGLDLTYNKNRTNATLTGSQSINTTGGYQKPDGSIEPQQETMNTSATFSFDRAFSKSLAFRYNEGYSANKGGVGRRNLPADQEGNRNLTLTWNGKWKGSFKPSKLPEDKNQPAAPGSKNPPTSSGGKNQPITSGGKNQPGTPRKSEQFTVELKYQRTAIDYDKDNNTSDNSVQVNDILPGVEITLPRNLINDGAYFNTFKLSVQEMVTGRRRAPIRTMRAFAQMSGSDRVEFSKSSYATTSLDLRQYFYSGENQVYNAQYVIAPRITYNFDPRSGFRFDTTWSMNYRQGVREPPVASDRQTYNQTLSYGMSYTNYRSWQYALRGSYNLAHDILQPFSSTFTWDPSRTFGLSQTFTLSYPIGVIPGDTSGKKRKRFKVDSPAINGVIRSPYIDDNGFYNWQLRFNLSNVPGDAWQTQRFRLTYFKKFQRGWSTEILGAYERKSTLFKLDSENKPTTEPVDFFSDFRRRVITPDFIKKIAIRKTNCCTTIEGGWRSELHEFYINMYLNALPQYPGQLTNQRIQTTSGGVTGYDYSSDFAFPTQSVFGDIMTDVFGTNPFPSTGYGF